MCGRFTLRKPLNVLAKQFQFDLNACETDKFDQCWYYTKPPEGVILVRVNNKFVVPANSMATAGRRH